jgi:outer membrane protein OmpA-like peptidoglycan-associated protein
MRSVAAFVLCGALAACAHVSPKPVAMPAPKATETVILFQGHATAILPKAAAIVNSVAANANAHPDKVVQILGPPTKPSFGYNPKLAAQRVQEVERALEAAGVDKERIVRVLIAAANLKADGTGAQQIEIRLVGKPAKPAKPPRKSKARVADAQPSQFTGLTPY